MDRSNRAIWLKSACAIVMIIVCVASASALAVAKRWPRIQNRVVSSSFLPGNPGGLINDAAGDGVWISTSTTIRHIGSRGKIDDYHLDGHLLAVSPTSLWLQRRGKDATLIVEVSRASKTTLAKVALPDNDPGSPYGTDAFPTNAAADDVGNLWFLEAGKNVVGYVHRGHLREISLGPAGSLPTGSAAGRDYAVVAAGLPDAVLKVSPKGITLERVKTPDVVTSVAHAKTGWWLASDSSVSYRNTSGVRSWSVEPFRITAVAPSSDGIWFIYNQPSVQWSQSVGMISLNDSQPCLMGQPQHVKDTIAVDGADIVWLLSDDPQTVIALSGTSNGSLHSASRRCEH